MLHKEEQQAERGFLVDRNLVLSAVDQTREVNMNLGSLLNLTFKTIRRSNILIALLVLVFTVQTIQMILGVSIQRLQEAAKIQLLAVANNREELIRNTQQSKDEVSTLQGQVEALKEQMSSMPSVTVDSNGRMNLEVVVESGSGNHRKLMIPLRPQRSRISR